MKLTLTFLLIIGTTIQMVKSDSTLTEYASNVGQSITNSINSALDTMGHSYSWLKGYFSRETTETEEEGDELGDKIDDYANRVSESISDTTQESYDATSDALTESSNTMSDVMHSAEHHVEHLINEMD